MNVLLDECIPAPLKRHLEPHAVSTVTEMRWAGKKNGELLRLAGEQFDVFLTVDRNLRYQQNLLKLPIAVILLVVRDNSIDAILPLLPKVKAALDRVTKNELVIVSADV